MTITEFLEARLSEDEVSATFRECHRESCDTIPHGDYSYPCDCGFPKRMAAECAAKRAIIQSYRSCVAAEDTTKDFGPRLVTSGMVKGMELAVKHLASAYHTHPEYERDWADELIRGRKSE